MHLMNLDKEEMAKARAADSLGEKSNAKCCLLLCLLTPMTIRREVFRGDRRNGERNG